MTERLYDRDARCPFFLAHTPDSVLCEGAIPETRARVCFMTKEEKDVQYEAFCCGRFDYCEMYRAVRANYDDADE